MTVSASARRRAGLAAAGAVLAFAAWPSTGQEPAAPPPPPAARPSTGPKSLLPDSFGPAAPAPVVAVPPPLVVVAPPPPDEETATETASAATVAEPTGPAVGALGPLTPALGGYGAATFSGSDGRFVTGLIRRLRVPLASRWAHIVLRRALLSESVAPPGINPADWVADRAALLLRMGEVDGAHALTEAVAVDRFTPRLYRVAGQVALATGDLPALCPLADTGGAVSPDPLWRLAEAICASLTGDDITAASAFDALRDARNVDPFDVRLGERVATISGGGGRAANIEWEAVDRLTPYRFGVASAAGVAVPLDRLEQLGTATGGTSWGWVWRSAIQPEATRAAAMRPAAVIGIASASEMAGAIAAASADLDRDALDKSPAGTLRQAYAAPTATERVAAMRTIWSAGDGDTARYSALIETALAAARLPVDRGVSADAGDLIASMLSAGLDRAAARWWPIVDKSDDKAGRRGWALLAVGANGGIAVSPDRFRDWMDDDASPAGKHRAALLLAALDGLGHSRGGGWGELRDALGLVPQADSWTRAIDAAAAAGRVGEVAVLAATGLQARWATMPPAQLAHIVAAYVRVGRGHEARMLAAEAVTRG